MMNNTPSLLGNNQLSTLIKRLPRWLVILLIFPLIFLNGWMLLMTVEYFQSLIATFIAASLLAFLLNYPPNGYNVLIFLDLMPFY